MVGIIIAGGLLLIILGISLLQKHIYQKHWSRNLTYALHASKTAVFEGDKIIITDSISNGKRLPLPWVHVSYKLSAALVYLSNISHKISRGERRSLLYIVGMNKTISRKSTVLCSKRGYYTVTEFSFAGNNPFMTGFATKDDVIDFNLLVYPRLVNYSESVIPLTKLLGDVSVRRFIDPDPFTFKGVREYQPFDSFRQVNWKATAKSGELMSNIYDFTVYQDIVVLLDLSDDSEYVREYVQEEAIRVAAFICRSCINMNIPVSLVCPASDGNLVVINSGSSRAHLEKIYTALAFIDINVLNHSVDDHIPLIKEKAYILVKSNIEMSEIEITANSGEVVKMEVIYDAEN